MLIETVLLTAYLTAAITVVRRNGHKFLAAWSEARWYERIALTLLIVPIPGPVDELIALLVIRRIAKRRA